MRRILVEKARAKSRLKRGGGLARLNIEDLEVAASEPDEKVILINEALDRLEAEDPERARLVALKFFCGLSNREVADTLGLSERTVNRQWTYSKAWLYRCVREIEGGLNDQTRQNPAVGQ